MDRARREWHDNDNPLAQEATVERRWRGNRAHVGDDSVDVRVGVAIAVLACRELTEVAGGDGADRVEEAEYDAACVGPVDLDIKLGG